MNQRMSEYVPVKMTPTEVAALRSLADERSCSVAAVVRWAVRKAMIDPPDTRKNESKEAPKFAETGGASFLSQS